MTIYFRDDIGECACDIDDGNGVQFIAGQAWFASDGREYRIDLDDLIEIIA